MQPSAAGHPSTEAQLFGSLNRLLSGRVNLRQGTTAPGALKIDAFQLLWNGAKINVAAAEPAFTATTHDIADPDANGREAIYSVLVSLAGVVTLVKGADAALGAGAEQTITANTFCVAVAKVAHNGTAIFDATTDSLSAAHLTVTYEDRVLPIVFPAQ